MYPLEFSLSRIDDSGRVPYDVGIVKGFSDRDHAVTEITLQGMPEVQVVLRHSARAKRMTLRVSQLDGRVTLTVPKGVPDRDAAEFVWAKENWIRGHLQRRPLGRDVQHGSVIPLEGKEYRIIEAQGRRIIRAEETLGVPCGPVGPRLKSWLKELARDRLAAASDHYSDTLGQRYSKITMRDTRSRWGSCTANGGLMYSWRLIMAPPDVLRYVAAHEVAHLAEMNHSPAFWSQVERLYGAYDVPRNWLRTQGNVLHSYRF